MKNQSNLIVLGIVTVVALGAATLALLFGRDGGGAPPERGVLFPALKERVNDVARLRIRNADGERTLALRDGEWGIEECAGYPADFEKVKEAIFKVANLEIEAVKTKLPANHAQLGVEEVAEPPDDASTEAGDEGEPPERSHATHVTLWDAQGEELADVILGKTDYLRGSSLVYARRADEDQVYQCQGRSDLRTEVRNWADTKILAIPASRVQAVTIDHGPAERVEIVRQPGDGDKFALADIPEGRKEKYAGVANTLGGSISSLTLEDVRQVADVDFAGDTLVTTEFTLEDGLSLVLRTVEQDDKTWAHVTARYEEPVGPPVIPDAAPPAEDTPPTDAEEGTDTDTGTDTEAEAEAEDAEDAAAKARLALAQEANDLNERLGPWAFALPSYRATNLRQSQEDFLAEPEPEPATEEAPGGLAPEDGLQAPVEEGASEADTTATPPPAEGSEGTATEEGGAATKGNG